VPTRTAARRWPRILTAVALVAIATVLAPTAPAHAVREVDRVAGKDRYSTSVDMSRTIPGGTDTVFLVSGEDYPDALAAAPVVAAERGRMLLTTRHQIPAIVQQELRRLAPAQVVLVGGEPTLFPRIQAQAAAMAPRAEIVRIAGTNRVDTAMQLLDRLRQRAAAGVVWVASGRNFPDALAAGAVAARQGHGLVLTLGANEQFTQQIQERLPATTRFIIVGSAASVDSRVEAMLRQTGRAVERIEGRDRYATAAAVNTRFTTSTSTGRILLASGAGFPDALGGAVVSGLTGSPLYLTTPACASTDAVLWDTRRISATGAIVLGGLPSVSTAAAHLIGCGRETALQGVSSLINAERAELDEPVDPLAAHACLDSAAQGWANHMASRQLAGTVHNPNLTTHARACAVRSWGEIVGRTVGAEPDPEAMVERWMNSAPHARIIERGSFDHFGVGVARSSTGSWYYVVVFGTV